VERDLVRLGRLVAAALLGADVDDGRAFELEDARERLEQRVDIVIPRSSNSWPGLARLTTDRRSRWLHMSALGPITGIRRTTPSHADLLDCQAPLSLIFER